MSVPASTAAGFVRVEGVRYVCKRQYVSTRGLDPLAQFFHDKVLRKERRVSVLVNSFGLPRRVIEDILAELLHRNYAVLDIASGEIRPLENAQPRRERRLGDDLEVWQDDVTGAFLPARDIDRYTTRPSGRIVHLDVKSRQPDFFLAPDARIIDGLRAVQPSIMEDPERPGFVLDALPEKERIGIDHIYVPFEVAQLADQTLPYIDQPRLPYWVTHEWTAHLDKGESKGADDNARIPPPARRPPRHRESAPSVLDQCLLEFQLQRWSQTIRELRGTPGGVRFRDRRLALLERLRCVDVLRFAAPDESRTHIQELWARAERYLMIVSDAFCEQSVAEILRQTVGSPAKRANLILISAGGIRITLPQLEHDRRGEVIAHHIGARISPSMCIVDGVEARVGGVGLMCSSDSALCVEGARAVESLALALQNEMEYREGGWWIRRELTSARAWLDVAARIHPGVAALAEQIEYLNDEIELELEKRRQKASSTDDAGEGDAAGAGDHSWSDPFRSRAESLAYEGAPLAEKTGALVLSVPPGDQRQILVDALTLAGVGGRPQRVNIIASSVPDGLQESPLVAHFESALARGTRIHITAVPRQRHGAVPHEALDTLHRLQERIGSELLTVSTSSEALPAALLVDDHIVVIGGGSWFRYSKGITCTFAAEAPRLASELRRAAESR